ncbi:MAG: RraA family protein [Opitutales bacterium]|nr:RraA family protein [Opitutales bacterium]
MNWKQIKEKLYVAVICDSLDSMGYRNQSPRVDLAPCTGIHVLLGRCKTTLWADMYHDDPKPYDLELKAVDSCREGDVLIAAAGGSRRSGIFGELLSTAARNRGCVGALVHGSVRDIDKMTEMGFPVFATSRSPYDSMHRQRVIDMDIPVEIDGVVFRPGDLVFADLDGVVVVPKEVEEEVLKRAMDKVSAENVSRDAIKKGMKASDAYAKYGVL